MVNRPSKSDQKNIIEYLARAGYAARGVVYLLVGGLAILAIFGRGREGQTDDTRGALQWVLGVPLGDVLLGAIAIGLLGYATWRSIQAIKDPDHHGKDAKGMAIRAGMLASAVTHTLLAIYAASLIFTFEAPSSGGGESGGLANWLMSQPFGQWLVGAAGLILIGVGLALVYKGWKAKFDRYFDMPADTQSWAYPLCRFGLAMRGLVFAIVGGFYLIAAFTFDPQEAGGIAEVFSTLREQPFGPWLIAFVALGLFAFGVYSILEAIYRRVNPSS